MNLKQIIKNIFNKFKQWTGSLVEVVPDHPTAPSILDHHKQLIDLHNAEFLKWKNDTPVPVDIPDRADISIDMKPRRDPMVKIYQEVRQELNQEKVSDNQALAELVNIQTTRAATALNNHVSDLLNGAFPGACVMGIDPVASAELQRELDAIIDEPTPEGGLSKYLVEPPPDLDRTVRVLPIEDISLEEFARNYPTSRAANGPTKLPPYKPSKKLTRSEKKKLKAIQQQENLKMNRGQKPPAPKSQVEALLDVPMSTDFAEAVMNNNKSISDLIASLEDGSYVEPVRVAAPGVYIPPVSDVMGDNYGSLFQWSHPDDQFIRFKILTRIVVSDPTFFSQYILRKLNQEDLNAYPIDYCECFAAIEELAPAEDLGAIAIMDQDSYCILVAWQNVFGMLIIGQDDVIDIKRRSAGFEDPHPTGYYHMTFARFDSEALIRMDLVGRHEYGYAEQIPDFKVNFAKFNHEETDATPTPTPPWAVNPSF